MSDKTAAADVSSSTVPSPAAAAASQSTRNKNPLLSASVTGITFDDFPNKPLLLPAAPPIVHSTPLLPPAPLSQKDAKSLVTVGYSSKLDNEPLDEINLNSESDDIAPPVTSLQDTNNPTSSDSILSQAASSFSALPSVASNVLSTFSKHFYAGNGNREYTPPATAPQVETTQDLNANPYTEAAAASIRPDFNLPTEFNITPNIQPAFAENPAQFTPFAIQNPKSEDGTSIPGYAINPNNNYQIPAEPPKLYTPAEAPSLSDFAKPPPTQDLSKNTYRLAAKKKVYAPIPGLSEQVQQATLPAFDNLHIAPPLTSETPVNQPPAPHNPYQEPPVQEERKGGLFSLTNLVPSGVLQNISGIVQSAAGSFTQSSPRPPSPRQPFPAPTNYFGQPSFGSSNSPKPVDFFQPQDHAAAQQQVPLVAQPDLVTPIGLDSRAAAPPPLSVFDLTSQASKTVDILRSTPSEASTTGFALPSVANFYPPGPSTTPPSAATQLPPPSVAQPPPLAATQPPSAAHSQPPTSLPKSSFRLQKGTKLYKTPFSAQETVATQVSHFLQPSEFFGVQQNEHQKESPQVFNPFLAPSESDSGIQQNLFTPPTSQVPLQPAVTPANYGLPPKPSTETSAPLPPSASEFSQFATTANFPAPPGNFAVSQTTAKPVTELPASVPLQPPASEINLFAGSTNFPPPPTSASFGPLPPPSTAANTESSSSIPLLSSGPAQQPLHCPDITQSANLSSNPLSKPEENKSSSLSEPETKQSLVQSSNIPPISKPPTAVNSGDGNPYRRGIPAHSAALQTSAAPKPLANFFVPSSVESNSLNLCGNQPPAFFASTGLPQAGAGINFFSPAVPVGNTEPRSQAAESQNLFASSNTSQFLSEPLRVPEPATQAVEPQHFFSKENLTEASEEPAKNTEPDSVNQTPEPHNFFGKGNTTEISGDPTIQAVESQNFFSQENKTEASVEPLRVPEPVSQGIEPQNFFSQENQTQTSVEALRVPETVSQTVETQNFFSQENQTQTSVEPLRVPDTVSQTVETQNFFSQENRSQTSVEPLRVPETVSQVFKEPEQSNFFSNASQTITSSETLRPTLAADREVEALNFFAQDNTTKRSFDPPKTENLVSRHQIGFESFGTAAEPANVSLNFSSSENPPASNIFSKYFEPVNTNAPISSQAANPFQNTTTTSSHNPINFFDSFSTVTPQNPNSFPNIEINTDNDKIPAQTTNEEQTIQNFFNNPPLTENLAPGSSDLNYDLVHSRIPTNQFNSGALTPVSNIVEPPSSACSEFSELNNSGNKKLLGIEGGKPREDNEEPLATGTADISKQYEDLPEDIIEEFKMSSSSMADSAQASQADLPYTPAVKHWFYKHVVNEKVIWSPFSHYDSALLETSLLLEGESAAMVAVEGGRFDVNIHDRVKIPVYWEGSPIEVRRCSWFYKGVDSKYMPYEEAIADLLENEYKQAKESGEWRKKIMLAMGEQVVFHGPTVMVHFQQQPTTDAWGGTASSTSRPRVVKRDLDDFTIEQGESQRVDHLLFMVHGIGAACDLKMRRVEEVVDDFRTIGRALVESHYKNSTEMGLVGRVEVLPISWHSHLHSTELGIDEKLKAITLESIPKLRNFTNDTLLDILFYTSPTFCQRIMNTVATSLNAVYIKYRERNPNFNGGVSLAGHSLGSLILFDLLCHQEPIKESEDQNMENPDLRFPASTSSKALNDLNEAFESNHAPSAAAQGGYMMGPAGTGQPLVQYGQLVFHPKKFFALGSPIGMFVTIRGIDKLGLDFRLPTCPGFYNIFHPFDPVAYRIEALVNPDLAGVRPVLIAHHKGRKRMHLELKETVTRVGADLKQRFFDTFKSTFDSVSFFGSSESSKKDTENALIKEVDMALDKMAQQEKAQQQQQSPTSLTVNTPSRERTTSTSSTVASESDILDIDFPLGKLNDSKRIDYVLQEAPLEFFNEYIFALTSHVCYWDSSDTILFVMKEIYTGLGITPDSQVPQQTMTIERQNVTTPN